MKHIFNFIYKQFNNDINKFMNPICYFLISIILFASCESNYGPDPVDPNKPPELPPLTMEGKNTLGCKINGQNWVAYVGLNTVGDQAFRMGYDSTTGHFGINSWWINKDRTIHQKVGFESYLNNNILGQYTLYRDIASPDFINGFRYFWIDKNLNNQLDIIFYNKEKKIISGTFEFTVIDTVNADTLVITEGRFDGKY